MFLAKAAKAGRGKISLGNWLMFPRYRLPSPPSPPSFASREILFSGTAFRLRQHETQFLRLPSGEGFGEMRVLFGVRG